MSNQLTSAKKAHYGVNPANIYLFKVNNINTRKRYEICSKLTTKTQEQHHWHCSGSVNEIFKNLFDLKKRKILFLFQFYLGTYPTYEIGLLIEVLFSFKIFEFIKLSFEKEVGYWLNVLLKLHAEWKVCSISTLPTEKMFVPSRLD